MKPAGQMTITLTDELEQFVPLTLGVAVIRTLAHDVHGLVRAEADTRRDQVMVRAIRRIDVPGQPVRIAEAVRPNLLASASG